MTATRKVLAAILELAFAYVAGPVDEMQLVLDIRLFKRSPKPDALFLRVAGENRARRTCL